MAQPPRKSIGWGQSENSPEPPAQAIGWGEPTPPVKVEPIPLNDAGYKIGEHHHRAKLTNAQVEEIRDRYEAGEDGSGPKVGYRVLAKEYGVGKRTIRDIVNLNRRNHWAARWAQGPVRICRGRGA